jgi:tRNA(Ile)-lysidine synthase
MLATIQRTIAQSHLRQGLRKVVVAVSGGSDSVALLHALRQLWQPDGIELVVAHIDHGLRGADSQADARFVAELSTCCGLRCRTRSVDIRADARGTGESLEMAARRVRYAQLADIVASEGADALCTGHTLDDQVETLLLRLGRGTGPQGLGGIAPRSVRHDGLLVLRPLLACRHSGLRGWLAAAGLVWREDASNADANIPRNRVRQTLMPAFEDALGRNSLHAAARALDLVQDEEQNWLQPLVRKELDDARNSDEPATLNCAALRCMPLPLTRRVLLAWLHEHCLPAEHQTAALVARLTAFSTAPSRGTRRLPLGAGCAASRTYETLGFLRSTPSAKVRLPPVDILVPGVTSSPTWGIEIEARFTRGIERPVRSSPLASLHTATLCYDLVEGRPLVLRSIRPGDRMVPVGASGHTTLADILVNEKVPRNLRGHVPVITCGGEVAWLPGIAVALSFQVQTDESRSLRLTLRKRGI